jgi:hypothetical protein
MPAAHQRIGIDGARDAVDELNDELGQVISRRRLAGEEETPVGIEVCMLGFAVAAGCRASRCAARSAAAACIHGCASHGQSKIESGSMLIPGLVD